MAEKEIAAALNLSKHSKMAANLGKETAATLSNEDLISEILVRLPVKSLLICRCVCKAWLHLIDSPNFIDMHLKHSSTITDRILITHYSEDVQVLSFHDYESFDLVTSFNLNLDPIMYPDSLVISGPCNGLLCFLDCDSKLLLYNPSLRVQKVLPSRPFRCRKGWRNYVKGFGFGFVSNPNDYKVISLASFSFVGDEANYDSEDEPTDKVEIYDMSTNSWRQIEGAAADKVEIYDPSTNSWTKIKCDDPYEIYGDQSGTLFGGALHWTANRDCIDIILSFDLTTEVFRQLELPNDLTAEVFRHLELSNYHLRRDEKYESLTVLNDSLGLFVFTLGNNSPEKQFIEIWVMREYGVARSWSKQFRIGPLEGTNSPLMLWKNESIFLESIKGQLLSCALDTNEIEEFEIQSGGQWFMEAMVFRESLISLP